jgi:hypothetical protein
MKRILVCAVMIVFVCSLMLALEGCGKKAAPGAAGTPPPRPSKREGRQRGREKQAPAAKEAAAAVPAAQPATTPPTPAPAAAAVIAQNETKAIGNSRVIVGAEVAYHAATGAYGTLDALINATPPYLDKSFASGKKDGYVYTVTGAGDKFTCTAVPETPGQTGVKRCFVDESGVIRHTTDGTEPSASSPPVS